MKRGLRGRGSLNPNYGGVCNDFPGRNYGVLISISEGVFCAMFFFRISVIGLYS